jgi:peptidoglycan hydrolase-like amidase
MVPLRKEMTSRDRSRLPDAHSSMKKALVGLLVATATIVGLVGAAAPASADDTTLTFAGRGWGHGRGMGQYGALGYAVNYGWSYDQILAHFYGGTSLQANAGNPTIRVELVRLTGQPLIVTAAPGLAVNGVAVGNTAVNVVPTANGHFQVYTASDCAGGNSGWSPWGGEQASGVAITSLGDQSSVGNLLRECEVGMDRGYRGSLLLTAAGSTSYVLNELSTEQYLRGVVPRESPASWGDLGGGTGFEALKAQAVAARGYALSGSLRASGANTCDTTACQVYLGAYEQPTGGAFKALDDPRTDRAVNETAGQVMRTPGGGVARTEFSSSTGGWTTGTSFTNVEDLGDAISLNPNRNWTATFTLSTLSGALGVGPLSSIDVTGRNGLGADGGRVTQVTLRGTDGGVTTRTGDQIRVSLGLKSNWFVIGGVTPGQAASVVKALYQDVLGRAPEPAGLSSWTTILLTTGNPQVITNGIVYSRERLNSLIAVEYRNALHREPEAGGLDNWALYLERNAGLSDLQAGVYGSQESLNVLGGGDTRTWVGAMYAAILGRPASDAERSEWADVALRDGRVRAVAGIAKSDEAGLRRLDAYYQTYLGRGLDPVGARTWLPYMAGAGDFQVPGFIGGSAEYWARSQVRFP